MNLRRSLIYLAVSLGAGLIMISSESIWIDEGQTLRFAKQPSLAAWFHELTHNTKSEAQMPLGMLVAWLGGKAVGLSEWQFRAPNLIWIALGGLAVGLTGQLLRQPALLPFFLINPFLWSYANEARPYAMLICAGAWALYVLARVHINGRLSVGDLWIAGGTAIVGFGASLLFAFALAGTLAAAIVLWRQGKLRFDWTARHYVPFALTAIAVGLLGLYYLYTLKQGAAGARLWKVTPLNLAFALYEMLGFSGFGPPRHELREMMRTPAQLMNYLLQPLPLLGLGTLTVLYAIIAARLWKLRRNPVIHWLLAFILIASGALYVAAAVVKFPFWGRHLASLLPSVIALVAEGASIRAQALGFWRRNLPLLLLGVCLLASSLILRFSPTHRKDDYRTAAQLALQALAADKVVWWCADPEECAVYYGLTPDKATSSGARLVLCNRPTKAQMATWPDPNVVFQSKPDIFDPHHFVQAHVEAIQFRPVRQLPAFKVWAKPGTDAEALVSESRSAR